MLDRLCINIVIIIIITITTITVNSIITVITAIIIVGILLNCCVMHVSCSLLSCYQSNPISACISMSA